MSRVRLDSRINRRAFLVISGSALAAVAMPTYEVSANNDDAAPLDDYCYWQQSGGQCDGGTFYEY